MTSHSSAVLASNQSDPAAGLHGLRIASNSMNYSTNPHTVLRELLAIGISRIACTLYIIIKDRQMNIGGECFRSNAGLADECKCSPRSISRAISELKAAGFLQIWYKNGHRRLRIIVKGWTGESYQLDTGVVGTRQGCLPDKANNIKKTTTTATCVVSLNLSKEAESLLGDAVISRLVDSFGRERVKRGLLAFEAADKKALSNPVGWFTEAIKNDWLPKPATDKKQAKPIEFNDKGVVYFDR